MRVMEVRTPLVKPDPTFSTETRTRLNPFAVAVQRDPPPMHRYGTQSDAELYDDSCRALGVSAYHMAKLIGARHPNVYPYRWLSGKRRIGRHYMRRIHIITLKAHFGTNFATIGSVDWETGEAVATAPDPPKGYNPAKPLKATRKRLRVPAALS